MKISDEATALASVLLGILETEASEIRQAALGFKIQSALDAARNRALNEVAERFSLLDENDVVTRGYVARTVHAMKVPS